MNEKELLKNLVIDYVFDGEDTTEGIDIENLYLGLNELFTDYRFEEKYGYGMGVIREGFNEPGVWITFYSEKIGGHDIMLEYITKYSIEGIVEHIEKAVKKSNLI